MKRLNIFRAMFLIPTSMCAIVCSEGCTPEIPVNQRPDIRVYSDNLRDYFSYCNGVVKFRVCNFGPTATTAFYVKIFNADRVMVDSQLVVSIKEHNQQELTYTPNARTMTSNLVIVADPENYIKESVEDNNVLKGYNACP